MVGDFSGTVKTAPPVVPPPVSGMIPRKKTRPATMDARTEILGLRGKLDAYLLYCLWSGLKPVGKQPVGLAALAAAAPALQRLGLTYVLSDFFYRNPAEGFPDPDGAKIAYLSRDPAAAAEARRIDAAFACEFYVWPAGSVPPPPPRESTAPLARALGKLLGYPSCCVEAFVRGDCQDAQLFGAFAARVADWRDCDGRLCVLEHQLVQHVPCSTSCAASRALAEKGLDFFLLAAPSVRRSDVLGERTYFLFPSCEWACDRAGKYSFGSYLGRATPAFSGIRKLLASGACRLRAEGPGSASILGPDGRPLRTVSGLAVMRCPEIRA